MMSQISELFEHDAVPNLRCVPSASGKNSDGNVKTVRASCANTNHWNILTAEAELLVGVPQRSYGTRGNEY
tara:strand:- start:6234 stop:6446 length:213 start_codon:yes stop_codon:yes gene_type:complete